MTQFREELRQRASESGAETLFERLGDDEALAENLSRIAGCSPFLRSVMLKLPGAIDRALDVGTGEALREIDRAIAEGGADRSLCEADLQGLLRKRKLAAHLLIALDDLGGNAGAAETVARMSALAESCVRAAIDHLLRTHAGSAWFRPPDADAPQRGSGLIVLGMGKLGGGELNVSSDIDLVLFYDRNAPAILDQDEAAKHFPRLARRLIALLADQTEDGYVFRTDLRLRPDPSATPLAISTSAALSYYESRGQNWERAAFIKARPIAGDEDAASHFLEELRPFIWRRHLDIGAIEDIRAIKRRIQSHHGFDEIAVAGHNIKLGWGGIREIEFFVQCQQLIAGGRSPDLRGRSTTAMLTCLAELGWIEEETAQRLTHHYWFLRDVEHAVQFVQDAQTHIVPATDEARADIASLLRLESLAAFDRRLRECLSDVRADYAGLFEEEPDETATASLVFTGEEADPATLQALSAMGFKRPEEVIAYVRRWHGGRYRAMRTRRASEQLTALEPQLIAAVSRTGDPDATILRLDNFLAELPTGLELFSILRSRDSLLDLLLKILSASPRLANVITRRAHVFDALIDPAGLDEEPDAAELTDQLDEFVELAESYEVALDRLRIFVAERKFLIGARQLAETYDGRRAALAYSDLAEAAVRTACRLVEDNLAVIHGRPAERRICILGMGKFGSREMTATSDLDLIVIYDHAPGRTDGERSIEPEVWFMRFTQRLISALSAATAQGSAYEMDLRLRPSGNQGPLATSIGAFRRYQTEAAQIWEHMAMTRSRGLAGDAKLIEEAEFAARQMRAGLDDDAIRAAAAAMRGRIERDKPASGPFDLKLAAGGVIDLEFIAQVQRLTADGPAMPQRAERTLETLSRIEPGPGRVVKVETLGDAWRLYEEISQLIRLCETEGRIDPATFRPGLTQLLLRKSGEPDMERLAALLVETQQQVRAIFETLIGPVSTGSP